MSCSCNMRTCSTQRLQAMREAASPCLADWMPSACLLSDREEYLQGKLLQKQLEQENSLDPMSNTVLDPAPDLLKALQLYPERAEPYMVQPPLSQADEQFCIHLIS